MLLIHFWLIIKVASTSHPLALSRNSQDTQCDSSLIKCASNAVCIPLSRICNGNADCEDGSDELNCDMDVDLRDLQTNRILCRRDQYRCQDETGNCIPLDQTCDRLAHCRNGDDEDAKACQDCKTKKCGYKCRINDVGGECYCPDGSTLSDDGRSCSSVDFCQTDGGLRCQHYCNGDATGYMCSCSKNYYLAEDGHSCLVMGKNDVQFIIALGEKQILTIPLLNNSAHPDIYMEHKHMRTDPNYPKTVGYARSLAYNNHDDTIYLAPHGWRQHSDLTAFIDGKETVLRRDFLGPVHIAVDHVSKNIFYTQTYHSEPGIYTCTEDALFCKRIVAGKEVIPYKDYHKFYKRITMNGTRTLDNKNLIRMFVAGTQRQLYGGLALNPLTGKMLWIDNYGNKKLMMANMDGSGIEELYDNGKYYIYSIALDHIKNEAYFVNWIGFKILRINLKTKEHHLVVTKGVGIPYAISYFDGHLYWTSIVPNYTLRTAHIGSDNCTGQVLRYFNVTVNGLAIKHPHYQQMPSINPCTDVKKSCPWICVIIPGPRAIQGKCLCPDNYRQEEGTCIHDKTLNKKEHIHLLEAHSYVDVEYWKELCSKGTACLNGGECASIKANDTFGVTFCNCPSPFIGERCELSDPRLRSGWTVFWILFRILILVTAAFAIIYHNKERIRNPVRRAISRLKTERDIPLVRFILEQPSSTSEIEEPRASLPFSDPFSST